MSEAQKPSKTDEGQSRLTVGLGVTFIDVCDSLPDGVNFGDPITFQIARDIAQRWILSERERLAEYFDAMPGREMFGGTVADEIRAMNP